jgi:hypothetical protein
MKQTLQLNPRPLGTDQIVLIFPVVRLVSGHVEFDINLEDIPALIGVLQATHDKLKESKEKKIIV